MSVNLAAQALGERTHSVIELADPISVEALPTPALVLNRPKFESNIALMQSHMAKHGKGFRPHAKTHKCALIAKAQLEAGAVGICVAKISEALAMSYAGIEQILITSPLTTPSKLALIPEILKNSPALQMVVDSELGLQQLIEILHSQPVDGAKLGVLIDLDVAMGRTGNRNPDIIRRLIESVQSHPSLRFDGVQHYAGHLMHVEEFEARRNGSLALWESVQGTIDQLEQEGVGVAVVTGGGTGTYDIDVEVPCITDMQVGSYIFMDEEYRQVHNAQGERFTAFAASLSVACTTISEPTSKTITVDGGYKAFASDSVAPVCDELPDVRFKFAGDEHGVLIRPGTEQFLKLGQVLQFVVPHCDPTVNLHDLYWVQEADGLIHSAWPINARGCSW